MPSSASAGARIARNALALSDKNRSGHPQRAAPEAMASNASAPVQLAAAIDAMHTRVQSSITLMIFTGLPSARAQSVESICQHSLARSALKERLARLGRF